jgi:hypothetical protein
VLGEMKLSLPLFRDRTSGIQSAFFSRRVPVRKHTMKTLLLSILLAILALQGAVPALGLEDRLFGTVHATEVVQGGESGNSASEFDGSMEVSVATEELSDYLPFGMSDNEACCRTGSRTNAVVSLRSIILPTHTPPPRA